MVFKKAYFDDLFKEEVDRTEDKFDAEFDVDVTIWRELSEDSQFRRMMKAVEELEKAIAIPYGLNEDKDYRIYRLKEMRSKYIDIVVCVFMGADWCTQNIRAMKRAGRKSGGEV